jgi:hypothetical protein
MKTTKRPGAAGSTDPNVECSAPVGSKKVSPTPKICDLRYFESLNPRKWQYECANAFVNGKLARL